MSFPYMSWRQAILKSGLQSTTRHVLLTLGCHMNDAGESCYPSIDLLCEETGLSKPTVITHLKVANDAGWIVTEKHGYAGQKWARNEYRIAWPKVVKQVDHLPEKVVKEVYHLRHEGGKTDSEKVVKEVYSNSPKNSPVFVTSVTNPPLASSKKTDIEFDTTDGFFKNITEDVMKRWEEAYPKLDIDAELTRAELWYASNPRKRKKNHHRFLTNWLARAHDRMTMPPMRRPIHKQTPDKGAPQ